jgi:hypothetical protein
MGIISSSQKPGTCYKVVVLVMLMELAAKLSMAEVSSQWIYEKIIVDSVHQELSSATVRSRNSIHLSSPYDGVNHGLIMIRKVKGGDPEVLFAVDKGQFYTGEQIRVKIDAGDAVWIKVEKPADRRSDLLFIAEPLNFINQIKNAKELKIASQFSQNGEKTFVFSVDGLDMKKVGL